MKFDMAIQPGVIAWQYYNKNTYTCILRKTSKCRKTFGIHGQNELALVEVAGITILTTTVGTLWKIYTITQKCNQHIIPNHTHAMYDMIAMDAKGFVFYSDYLDKSFLCSRCNL